MQINKFTLAFKDKELEDSFQDTFFRQSLRQVRACLILGILVYTLFTIADGTTYPEMSRKVLWWRVITIDLALAVLLTLSYTSIFKRIWQPCLIVMMTVGVSGLAASFVTAPLPFRYTYHVAFILALIWAYVGVRMRFIWASLTGLITIVIYNACLLLLGDGIEIEIAINTNLDILVGNLMCMFAGYAIEFSLRKSYHLSKLLGEERDSLEQQVDLRTQNLMNTVTTLEQEIKTREQAEEERNILESQLLQAQKMDALGTLAGGIAHDFNNILAAIIGYSELALVGAEKGNSNSKQLKEVLKAGNRAKDLVTQILTFSRKLEPELKPLDLNQVVAQAVKMLARTIPKMINIEHHLAEDLWLIHADASQMSQVLMNLGTNARDAMPEGGRLVIKTENVTLEEGHFNQHQHAGAPPDDYMLLTVSDTGHGMDKETQEYIYDPFFTKKGVGQGTGLGLATVYGILKIHGGYITCYSEVGQGTTFKVYLPAIRSAEEIEISEELVDVEIPGGKETILLVDDEESLRDLGLQTFTHKGYQILLAESGEEAVDIYREKGADIDLIILDISMPGMGGHRCFQELLRINPEAKVIISSGYSRTGRLKDTLDSGAAGFAPKPFSRAEILKTIRQVLDG